MSNVAIQNYDNAAVSDATDKSQVSAAEHESVRLMTLWMVLGVIVGGYLGYASLHATAGTSLPATTMICAIAGSVVGAALGQIIGGLMHVIAHGSLDINS